MPGTPRIVTSWGERCEAAQASRACKAASSCSRPMKGEECRKRSTPGSAIARIASHALIGRGPSRCRDGLGFSILDRVTGRAERLLPDEDADRRGGRLQPRCHRHDIAHDYRLPVHLDPAERDVGLTRCDRQRNLAAVLVEPVTDGECCADSSLGIVLVGSRNAEQCHGGVADEPFNGSTEAFEVRADARVVGA